MVAVPCIRASNPLVDERRRRDEESLFADNVAFSRRAAARLRRDAATRRRTAAHPWPSPQPDAWPCSGRLAPTSVPAARSRPRAVPAAARRRPATAATADPGGAAVDRRRDAERRGTAAPLLEGTVIETVLINRLDGTFQGPVQCLVTTPVYAQDRQAVVIPAGARVLGSAAPVQAWGDSAARGQLSPARACRTAAPYSLDSFTGLNQVGETGLSDEVDRHYLQVFGASLAIGAISGLAQFGTRAGSVETSFGGRVAASAGASLATSTARVLDRYLNVLPTITIREGHRIKVVLTNDLTLPPIRRPSRRRASAAWRCLVIRLGCRVGAGDLRRSPCRPWAPRNGSCTTRRTTPKPSRRFSNSCSSTSLLVRQARRLPAVRALLPRTDVP